MSLDFQKRKENFQCANCGELVFGNGYTNHCPNCLWSRHVDRSPGDRKENCGGLMKPIDLEIAGDEHIITHQCQKCGKLKKNKTNQKDNFEAILKLSSVRQNI